MSSSSASRTTALKRRRTPRAIDAWLVRNASRTSSAMEL
jgi:hypothetical protein